MDYTESAGILADALGWQSPVLGQTIAAIMTAAFILWFAWIVMSQVSRLRGGELTVQQALGETARSLIVVIAAIALAVYLVPT